MPIATRAFAAPAADQPLAPYSFERRDPGPNDVVIAIKYCGVCHSDLHAGAQRDRPIHLSAGAGPRDRGGGEGGRRKRHTRFKQGDRVGVGCMVDSCRECASCQEGEEQYCAPGFTSTYGARDKTGGTAEPITQGGYSDHLTVDQHFVLSIPDSLPLDAAAPLLCAGVTTYSPLKEWKIGPGSKVAVIGLGGLGHMAVKLAAALGAEVTVLSTSDRKKADAERMGARHFLINSDDAAMKAAAEKFDLIINTISATHEIASHVRLLARDGTMVMLGLTTEALPVFALPPAAAAAAASPGPRSAGSAKRRRCCDFCARHGIVCDIETIAPAPDQRRL